MCNLELSEIRFHYNCNVVKQGGVLSAILFSMYIDPLLVELGKSGYGCHLDRVYTRALSYADNNKSPISNVHRDMSSVDYIPILSIYNN